MPTATISQVRARLAAALAALTPDLAPAQRFAVHDDFCALEAVTEPGRLRRFKIVSFSPRTSAPWNSTMAAYEQGLSIRIGYPIREKEVIGGESFDVEDLKDSDFRQIDWLVQAEGTFADLEGVQLARLGDASDEAGGRVRAIRYGLLIEEEH